jgi:hypothetical protein
MTRRLSIRLGGSLIEPGAPFGGVARYVTSALILVIAVGTIGGALVGSRGPRIPVWVSTEESTSSPASTDLEVAQRADPGRGDHANDDGYLDGLAKALGFSSLEQMTRENHEAAVRR